jgi:mannose-6-phosphate isomerase-like protein (cupin superfamily)
MPPATQQPLIFSRALPSPRRALGPRHPGGPDTQSPHTEDEIHVGTAGRARIETPGRTAEAGPGAVVFVPAGEEHRFTEVVEDLVVLVVLGPAYGSRSPSRGRENA